MGRAPCFVGAPSMQLLPLQGQDIGFSNLGEAAHSRPLHVVLCWAQPNGYKVNAPP